MGALPIGRLKAGMVLAEPVRNMRNRVLVPAGTALTERHLAAFRMWGIKTVDVVGEDDLGVEEGPGQGGSEAEGEVRARFGGADLSHPFLSALLDACVARAIGGPSAR